VFESTVLCGISGQRRNELTEEWIKFIVEELDSS
jgi:hypothetical protein